MNGPSSLIRIVVWIFAARSDGEAQHLAQAYTLFAYACAIVHVYANGSERRYSTNKASLFWLTELRDVIGSLSLHFEAFVSNNAPRFR